MTERDSPSPPPGETKATSRFPSKGMVIGRLKALPGFVSRKKSKTPPPLFPPPSWNIEDFNPSSINWTIPPPEPPPIPTDNQDPSDNPPDVAEAIEPVTLAKRLRSLIEMLPTSLTPGLFTTSRESTQSDSSAGTSAQATTPPPIPPEMDQGLIQILSSEALMNGDPGQDGKGKARPGIWGLLAGLGRSSRPGKEGSVLPLEEQESGIMMYAPIEPQSDSVLELASTETIKSAELPSPDSESPPPTTILPPEPTEIRLWVPSTTELSVLTTWWGYRLYLPPPVMAKLGGASVKAAARAAMITSALKWLINKIPLMLVPVQFRPAITMLKTLAPFAGYVGVFIAWSWDRIKLLDQGNGVVLTATWVLPVALIPMAWDAGPIFGPSIPPEVQVDDEDGKKGDKGKGKGKDETFRSRFV